jgi:hypothetical protein
MATPQPLLQSDGVKHMRDTWPGERTFGCGQAVTAELGKV